MQYSRSFKLVVLIVVLFIGRCSPPTTTTQTSFPLLPSVAEGYFQKENSMINLNTLEFAFSPTGDLLPLRYGVSKKLQKADQAENAQVEFSILPQKNHSAESYSLKIESEKIKIVAQDKAGLFYAFITLDQLLEMVTVTKPY